MDADTNICAVILNYNDAQTTMKLTESWKNSKVIRNIIIVDNCSTDDSWEKLGEFKEELASDHADNPDNCQNYAASLCTLRCPAWDGTCPHNGDNRGDASPAGNNTAPPGAPPHGKPPHTPAPDLVCRGYWWIYNQ